LANIAGAYVIAPRMREVAIALPPAAKKKKQRALRAAAKAPKDTRKKKVKTARSRAR
jgi:hypothetical protein